MFEYLNRKKCLVTGAGTLAYALAQELNCELAIYSRNEAAQFKFKEDFPVIKDYLGDIRDKYRLTQIVRDFKPDILIHTAAVKRVDIAENEPLHTIKNNILGTINVGEVAIENNIEVVIGIGTDKEVNSQTIYGNSKGLSNLCLLDMDKIGDTKFSIVRYGNVAASRSSVIVIWDKAAKADKPIKITNPDMTRFFFTVKEGVGLIDYGLNKTLNQNGHGKIYSTEMCAGTLNDLADAIIGSKYSKSKKEIIGSRVAVEKLHECLLSEIEIIDTIKTDDKYNPSYASSIELHYFITTPGSKKSNVTAPFTSDNACRLDVNCLSAMVTEALNTTWQG